MTVPGLPGEVPRDWRSSVYETAPSTRPACRASIPGAGPAHAGAQPPAYRPGGVAVWLAGGSAMCTGWLKP
jgi:hypothetical protein